MNPFGWCFIGTGRLADQVAKQLATSADHKILSCYTRDFQKAQAFAQAYGATAYERAEDAILAPGVEGVYIVTTHNVHFRFAKMALELGKPVLCEKSFTVTAAETDALIALAREKQLYLAEAMWTWFSPAANQVKRWIDSGQIGPVKHADFTYHMKSVAPRAYDPRRAGGALLNITVYPIAYAYRLFGYPETIESTGTIENGIDTGEEIFMTFPGGITCHISASNVDMKGLEKMKIQGEKGSIQAPLYHAMNYVTLHLGLLRKTVFRGPGPKMNTYLNEFNIVADEIRRGRTESEWVPLQATGDIMRIMDTIRSQIGLVYTDLEE